MNFPTSALSSPLSFLGSRSPSPPPGYFDSSSPAANKTSDTSSSPPTAQKHTTKSKSAPTTTIKKTKKSKQTKKAPTSSKRSPTKASPEPAEVDIPDFDTSSGLPVGYSAAKSTKLQTLLDERDLFADFTSQLLDPNESLVLHGRLAKIQEDTNKWYRGVRLAEATNDMEELASEVVDMDDEELAEAQERVAVLRKETREFERKVAERKALGEKDEMKEMEAATDSKEESDAPEGKDTGSGGDDEDDMMEKGNVATAVAGQKGKKRKRGVN